MLELTGLRICRPANRQSYDTLIGSFAMTATTGKVAQRNAAPGTTDSGTTPATTAGSCPACLAGRGNTAKNVSTPAYWAPSLSAHSAPLLFAVVLTIYFDIHSAFK